MCLEQLLAGSTQVAAGLAGNATSLFALCGRPPWKAALGQQPTFGVLLEPGSSPWAPSYMSALLEIRGTSLLDHTGSAPQHPVPLCSAPALLLSPSVELLKSLPH